MITYTGKGAARRRKDEERREDGEPRANLEKNRTPNGRYPKGARFVSTRKKVA